VKAPGEGQDAGGDTKGNDVGQRIQFLAKLAGRLGHARDAAIQGVKRDGEADRQGGVIEMVRLQY
jgi:hypothetical protein